MVSQMKRIFILIISFMFFGNGIAFAEINFSDSAHGNSSTGVKRKSPFPSEYSQGNCGHCHEQHASIGGDESTPDASKAEGPDSFCLLANNWSGSPTLKPYIQDDNSCFYCHTSSSTLQETAFYNYSYCRTFGGYTSDTTDSIMAAFNLTSYHNLYDLYRYITGQSDTKSFTSFPASSSPCSGCHNVHIAKSNKATPGNPSNTAISRPSDHNNPWGDDTPGERMTATGYGTDYQPPKHNGSSNLEPDNVSSDRATQAAKTPDYNTFCLDCHQNEVTSSSMTSVNPATTNSKLTAIDWSTSGEKHGKRDADTYIMVDTPYTAGSGALGYVLSCLDCHEPHGSSNVFLIRQEVNGGVVGDNTVTTTSSTDCDPTGTYTDTTDDWKNLCSRCHSDDYETLHHSTSGGNDVMYNQDQCADCHVVISEEQQPINCSCCHYHGAYVDGRYTF